MVRQPQDTQPIAYRAELHRRGLDTIEVTWEKPPKFDALSCIAAGVATFSLTVAAVSLLPELDARSAIEALDQMQGSGRAALVAPFETIIQALD